MANGYDEYISITIDIDSLAKVINKLLLKF
jgi:hypothetical protein